VRGLKYERWYGKRKRRERVHFLWGNMLQGERESGGWGDGQRERETMHMPAQAGPAPLGDPIITSK